jgi:hypothetical protein
MKFRSKFLNNFKTLADFTNSNQDFAIGDDTELLRQVKGAEKLFAAIIFCGESDFHAGNIGIIDEKDEFGNNIKAFAKIDHGWSATKFFSKPLIMIRSFKNAYDGYGYGLTIDLDAEKLIESFKEILTISNEEIKLIIGERIYKLKNSGFDLSNLRLPFWMNDSNNYYDDLRYVKFDNFEQLEKYYVANLIIQKQTMEKMLESLEKVANKNIHNKDSSWKESIAQNRDKDIYVMNR